ncbi:hypothetical protein ACQX0N_01215 [Clostridium tepidum]|uniref:PNPLA domain-containing protein n=1 Tax=Clostridium tepidum TaxID=1962263 RepID=A0A1S9I0R8_9CLOT|nr:hypothetical protein [Clostridium tepidum]MCR1933463.1 hypothetical protein [Clostridium tepidum]MDU6878140.1 hypothetical protein [Clostridium botulinum]OOO61731.1 hypothetical protein BS637_10685 [Clostridium tepidum]OOO63897.1 hypothetical protein BS638_12905 [Clostridium tepidum]
MKKDVAIAFIGNNIFYHLGAIKAIEEYNIFNKFNAVSGTGLGSLSAIMFAKKDYNSFKDLCNSINDAKKIYIKKDEIYKIVNMHTINKHLNEKIYAWSQKISQEGMISCNDMMKILNNKYMNIDENCFKIDCYLGCYELPFMRKLSFKLNDYDYNYLDKIILNSTAEPNIFTNKVKSKSIISGDINCELSIEILKDNNYENILIVDSDNMKIGYKYKGIEKNINNNINNKSEEYYIEKAYKDTVNIIKNNLKNTA